MTQTPARMSLPLGRSTFEAIRGFGSVYADKTAMIGELASKTDKIFLSRPRRFGKTLLVSTFEALFKTGTAAFRGLALEPIWRDKTYRVVRLDFSLARGCESREEFEKKFFEFCLEPSFEAAGFPYDPEDKRPFLERLKPWLVSQPANSLVLLIDEYDAPLTENLGREERLREFQAVVGDFFALVRQAEGCLRFFFMTGITRLSNTGLFSAFNNLRDISHDPACGALLGFTEDEVRRYFSPWVARSAEILGTREESVIEELRRNYAGYCFDKEASSRVFCPWSVLNFFWSPKLGFENYWFQSGGQPTVLMSYLKGHELADPAEYDKPRKIPFSRLEGASRHNELGLEALLFQTGYLSIREIAPSGAAVLGYPNREVSLSMARLYAEELVRGKGLGAIGDLPIAAVLKSGTADEVADAFNRAVNAIDAKSFPIRDEATCRSYLQVLLIGGALRPQVEVHSALGRSDMEVQVGDRRWVFEFKFSREKDDPAKLLEEAAEQIVSRRYGEVFGAGESLRLALVFSEKERRFVLWRTV